MKLKEQIELNGEEYTLELSREAFLQIDKICNIKKTMETLQQEFYEHIDEITDDYDPFAEEISFETINEKVKEKDKVFKKLITRALFVWLYPNYKFPISKVEEMLKPYFDFDNEDNEKFNNLLDKVMDCIEKCTLIEADSKN